jgi:3-oxoacyl-[acyl-carrier protein] reductase
VALVSRRSGELERAAGEVAREGVRALPVRCDVTDADAVRGAVERVLRELGDVDVVVNNAGIVRRGLVHEMPVEDWDRVIAVNLRGVFLVTRALLPSMLKRGQGRVITMGSISSTLGTAAQSAYAASKWGALGFTKSLAEELRGTGLVTMCVMPGSVRTSMLEGSGFLPQMTAEDVARLVAYASLDAPAAMNGSAIEMFGP